MKTPVVEDNKYPVQISDENKIVKGKDAADHVNKERELNFGQTATPNKNNSITNKNLSFLKSDIEDKDLDTYCEILRSCPCPVCNSVTNKINASLTATTVSFLLFTDYKKTLKIACPNCLNKMHDEAMIKSSLLGWWGLPWGFIKTLEALVLNYKMKLLTTTPEPNELFKNFVAIRIDKIKANLNNSEGLKTIIRFS